MATADLAQYIIFLLFLPIGLFSIMKGKFYLSVISVVVALVDLIFLGLKIAGVA